MEAEKILNDFINNKKNEVNKIEKYYYNGNSNPYQYRDGRFDKNDPMTKEEILADKSNDDKCLDIYFLPQNFWNKSFKIGEFEVTVQYGIENTIEGEDRDFNSLGYRREHWWKRETLNVFLNFHGFFMQLANYRRDYSIKVDHYLETQSNWRSWIPKAGRIYRMTEFYLDVDGYRLAKLDELFSLLVTETPDLYPNQYDIQSYWEHENDKHQKGLKQYTRDNLDVEYFVSREIKNAVYTPERATIDKIINSWYSYSWDIKNIPKNLDKKLLKKLGVKTVQLRNDAHFAVDEIFDMKGINIKAPQKVIERYNYAKYVNDEKMTERIIKKEQEEEQRRKMAEYNDTYSLVQHGKTILKDVSSYEIESYFEEILANPNNFETNIINSVKPIFDAYPDVNKLNLVKWGTYFQYENRGRRYGPDFEVNQDHLDEETAKQIHELYENEMCCVSENALEIIYGWEERGGTMLGVKKGRTGKFSLFTEAYDPE